MFALAPSIISPCSQPVEPLDDSPAEAVFQKAQLTTEELKGLVPTACCVLSLVNEGYFGADKTQSALAIRKAGAVATSGQYCLNPEVRSAIVKVMRATVSDGVLNVAHPKELLVETLAAIFKNGFDYHHSDELMGLIQTECPQFYAVIDKACSDLDLKGNLLKKSVVFSCNDRHVSMKPVAVNVDETISKATIDVLSTLPLDICGVICQYQEPISFEAALLRAPKAVRECADPKAALVFAYLKGTYDRQEIDLNFIEKLTVDFFGVLLVCMYAPVE